VKYHLLGLCSFPFGHPRKKISEQFNLLFPKVRKVDIFLPNAEPILLGFDKTISDFSHSIDLSYCITGRFSGGPAKTAVVASGFMGSVAGSAVANVVATGAFTIPMMKKIGYRRHVAAAIEAAASTGGQLMPPIMGAGAFLMAEFTQIPYLEIIKIAFIPAVLYFFSVIFFGSSPD
jgi:TRAP-type uncharacterized transport system fused permease subunit